jgi:hypothetical protein
MDGDFLVCKADSTPDLIKLGILSPVFKRKGSKNEAKNYRGITVLPVIGKCLEFLLMTSSGKQTFISPYDKGH